jgi:hypothetical protein
VIDTYGKQRHVSEVLDQGLKTGCRILLDAWLYLKGKQDLFS